MAVKTLINLHMTKTIIFIGIILLTTFSAQSTSKSLDFWDEEVRLFGVARAGQHIDFDISKRQDINYISKSFALDHSSRKVGDLSIVYSPIKSGLAPKFGFVADLWQGRGWNLESIDKLNFWLKAEGSIIPSKWRLHLIDNTGIEAEGTILNTNTQGHWKEISFLLKAATISRGFNWSSVVMCEFEATFSKDTKIWLDGIRFEGINQFIGVTDKPLEQRIEEAKLSKTLRIKDALRRSSKLGVPNTGEATDYIVAAFAKMMLNEDLENANKALLDELMKSSDDNGWSLIQTPLYCRFYYKFSSKGQFPGRMYPETEKLLLKTLWDRTSVKNDIHWSRQSTWYLDGSENHDLNAKACNLVSSRIFMNEPEYKDRIYPDYGFGGGYHYGHAGYYGPNIDPESRHGGGCANLSDGKKYNAKDHYEAWLIFLKTYFKERVERGFFLEYGSNTYSKHVLNMCDVIYQYSGDDELKGILKDFFSLYWAEWTQVSISGERGGPKTRHHSTVYDTDTSHLISFHLGGPANAGPWWYWNIIGDFELAPVVWKMALDREGMGCYTYKARGIGEEENVLPRPPGTERSLVVDTDSRFLKSTYVTPDYTLGTQMDHPSAVQSHLSAVGRWHGMTFSQSPYSRIVPVGLTNGKNVKGKKSEYDLEVQYQSALDKNTLIIQQNRRWYAIHPDWYPVSPKYDEPIGIWCGNNWDCRIEKDGWVFVQSGNAYGAFRCVLWDEEFEKDKKYKTSGTQIYFNAANDAANVKIKRHAYTWNSDSTILILEDKYAPIIIEAGRVNDYPTIQEFMSDVLKKPIELYKTVVPGNHILVYTGIGKDAREIVFNAAVPTIPTIGGIPIDYSYPMTFESPYLKSNYKSGKVQIQYDGATMDLDFTTRNKSN